MQLPPYLELYYQLFKQNFISTTESSSRYLFLCWLYSAGTNSIEIEKGLTDIGVLNFLSEPYDSMDLGSDTFLTQFDYYYFSQNSDSFLSWDYSLGSIKERQKYLSWCYSWGKDIPFFKMTRERMLTPSQNCFLDFFEITKFFELTIYGFDLLDYEIDAPKPLALGVARVLFGYSRFRYPLTQSQLLELSTPNNLEYLYSLYCRFYGGNLTNIDFKVLDISPELLELKI